MFWCLCPVLQIRNGRPTPWECLCVSAARASIETSLRSARWNPSCWIPGVPLRWRWVLPDAALVFLICVHPEHSDYEPCVIWAKIGWSIVVWNLAWSNNLQPSGLAPLRCEHHSPPPASLLSRIETSHPSQFSTAWKAWASSWQIQPISLCVCVCVCVCATLTLKLTLDSSWFHSENIQYEVKESCIVFINRVILLSSLRATKEVLCCTLPSALSLSVPPFLWYSIPWFVICSFLSACYWALSSILCVWIHKGHKGRNSHVSIFYKVVRIDVGSVFCKLRICADVILLCYVTHLVRVRIQSIQWCHAYKCWNTVLNSGQWLGRHFP